VYYIQNILSSPKWYKFIYTIQRVFLDIIINIGDLIEFQVHEVFFRLIIQNSSQNELSLLICLLEGDQSTILMNYFKNLVWPTLVFTFLLIKPIINHVKIADEVLLLKCHNIRQINISFKTEKTISKWYNNSLNGISFFYRFIKSAINWENNQSLD
jgi:hypothetical protein